MRPLSMSRAFTCFHVHNAEVRPYIASDGDTIPHMRKLFEPLNVTFPADAKPFCSSFTITFYDRTGNVRLGETQKHDLTGVSPTLLFAEGAWWELVQAGMVVFYEGQWVVERALSRSTRLAKQLNQEPSND